MKVAVFLGYIPPETGGGFTFQEEIFHALVEFVAKSKHTLVVICSHKCNPEIKESLQSRGIEIIDFNQSQNIFARMTSSVIECFQIWRESKLDQIARVAGVEFFLFLSITTKKTDIPYLTVVWDLNHRMHPWFPEVSANGTWQNREAVYSWFLRRASIIVCGTQTGKQEIESFYQIPSGRIKILPFPTPKFPPNLSSFCASDILNKYNLPKEYLFYPAQFWTHKNHANLLLAIQILHEKHNLDLPVVFVGSDQGNLNHVKNFVNKLGLTNQVYFLGFIPRNDVISLYHNALMLTFVDFCGPDNLPPLEAFSLGCPVVASNISGAEEQLGNAALLVDPKNPEEIALAIKSVYEDVEFRNTLIRRGFERAAIWTAEDYVKSLFSLLDEFEPIRRCWGH